MNETSRPEVTVSAGEVLKRLRQEKQMSVHDVAVKLYLDPWIIEALEENDFSRLPAATYSRGYLRSYAKLVDADADHLIALYDNNAPEPPEIIPDVKHPTQISSSDKPVKAITWMISLLLALLLISWIHSIYMVPVEDQPPAADTPTETTPAGDVESAPPVEETVSEPPVSDVPLPEPEAAPVTAETEAQAPESMLPENVDANSPAAGEPPAGGAPEIIESPTASDPVAADNAEAGAESGSDADGASEAAGGNDTLNLRLTADSWIEIYDRYGNKLYVNLARKGEEITLVGAAPFSVKLGFSQGVILEFNGEPFDPAPYSHAGVATFTLGE